MSYIKSFLIYGLAGRPDPYTQLLNRDVNVFFGLNGSGKTSLLKILHAAMNQSVETLKHVPFDRADVFVHSDETNQTYKLSYNRKLDLNKRHQQMLFIDDEEKFLEIERSRWVVHDEPYLEWKISPALKTPHKWPHRYLPTSRLWSAPLRQAVNRHKTEPEDLLDEFFESTVNRLWNSYMQKILEEVREAQEEGLANILAGIVSSKTPESREDRLPAETAYKRAKSFLKRQKADSTIGTQADFSSRYGKSSILQNVVGYIDDVEKRIEGAMMPRNKLQALISKMFSNNKKAVFSDSEIQFLSATDKPIRLSGLSSGEKQVLRILIECLHAQRNALIIDEPEISMHVDWQRELVASMRGINRDAQLILATHSPEVMADLPDNQIFRI